MQRERGRVIAFNTAEGHGVIRSEALGDELWVHFSSIEQATGFRSLAPGQVVEYWRALQPGPSGVQLSAQGVVVLPSSGADRYQTLLAGIASVVARVDPMGLLAGGAPSDEYGREVALLAPRVLRAASRSDVEAAVTHVFTDAFGSGSVRHSAIASLVEGLLPLTNNQSPDAG